VGLKKFFETSQRHRDAHRGSRADSAGFGTLELPPNY